MTPLRGLSNRGEMTGYLFLSSSPLLSLFFLALERERKTFCKISRLAAHTLNCQPISA